MLIPDDVVSNLTLVTCLVDSVSMLALVRRNQALVSLLVYSGNRPTLVILGLVPSPLTIASLFSVGYLTGFPNYSSAVDTLCGGWTRCRRSLLLRFSRIG